MAGFAIDHFHLFTQDVHATARWYRNMFGMRATTRTQSNGKPRVDLELDGIMLYVAELPASSPREARRYFGPLAGLEHLGLTVDDIDMAVEELRAKGAEILLEPMEVRPDVRIAFVKGPDDVRIELLHRGPSDFPDQPRDLD
ncbi:Catechol 2,3-dioxygenase [Sphingobium faniae]|nr:Catechol 2,3-dioxygenase [Sphingobium faniae]